MNVMDGSDMSKVSISIDEDKQDFRDGYDIVVSTLIFLRDKPAFDIVEVTQAINFLAKVCLFVVRMIGRRWL